MIKLRVICQLFCCVWWWCIKCFHRRCATLIYCGSSKSDSLDSGKSPVGKESVHGWNKHRRWAGSGDRFPWILCFDSPCQGNHWKFPHRDPRLSGKTAYHWKLCHIATLKALDVLSSYLELQVSFDVAWSPKCIDKRCYDYLTIADSCDLLFVMSYDEQSQIWGDCIAMANAPFNQTLTGKWFLEKIKEKLTVFDNIISQAIQKISLHLRAFDFEPCFCTWEQHLFQNRCSR